MSFGISTALLTPFHAGGSLNLQLLCTHANSVLRNGASGITPFGTTGEGASIGFDERSEAIAAILDSGILPQKITLGLCGSAVTDVAAQVQQGIDFGITKFLLLPPFYFKEVDDAGLFAWHAELFKIAGKRAQFILYNIPQISQVPLSFDLIVRLKRTFSDRVLAIKNSDVNWDLSQVLLESGEIPVLIGDERKLHKALALGGAGSICGMSNLYPRRLQVLFETHAEDVALSAEIDFIVSMPVVPALKQIMASLTGEVSWANLRAPLSGLSKQAQAEIATRYAHEVLA